MQVDKRGSSFKTRILIVDDEPEIHEDFKNILNPSKISSVQLEQAEALLFGDTTEPDELSNFQIDSAFQGEEGYEFVKKAKNDGVPYSLAFVDMRMPPGWDGLETILKIWEIDPHIEIAICTAYSDQSWMQIHKKIKKSDRYLILKKPFDPIEVLQLAHSLSEKWNLARQANNQLANLESLVIKKEQFVQAKDSNLASTAHDLKNPLNAILGYSQLCESLILKDGITNEKLTQYIHQIQKSGKRLLLLLNDVLDLTKMEAGKMKFNFIKTDLALIFQGAIQEFKPLLESKNMKIEVEKGDIQTVSKMDAQRMGQIARNLLSNAIKFSSDNQTILVRFEEGSSNKIGDWIGASVVDEGIGIPLEFIDTVFDHYVKSEKKENNIGNGLGLPICREIIHAHRGKIWAEMNRPRGTMFRFFVPRAVDLSN
ncbi:MAG: hybrid sensor histidine kinase/response regulator [Proteobacteria bacterium]|nr:hybrid sensor histidine kinase/response regulator [Pseudomonadota bacterium]